MVRNSRRFVNLDKNEQRRLGDLFHYLFSLEDGEPVEGVYSKAISVFDHWLEESEAISLLDGVSQNEVLVRFEPLNKFNRYLVDFNSCLTYRAVGRPAHRNIKFKKFADEKFAKEYVEQRYQHRANRYKFVLVIPALEVVYYEGSDFTNYLYCSSEDNLGMLINEAGKVGLHSLSL